MPKVAIPLTDTQLKNVKPTGKVQKLTDGDGLYLRVSPKGVKTWYLNYHHPVTRLRMDWHLGRYPDLSLAKARRLRQEHKSLLAEGIDPREQKQKERLAKQQLYENTFKKVALDWLNVKSSTVTADHLVDIRRSLENHLFPRIGNKPITQLNAPLVISTLKPLEAANKLDMLKRLCQRINEVMTYAINCGLLDNNPLAGISNTFRKPKKKHQPAIDQKRLPEFLHVLSISPVSMLTRCLIELQLHTMLRPNEIAGAKWEEIDFDHRIWRVPGSRMKGPKGRYTDDEIKHRLTHSLPLSSQVIQTLKLLQPVTGHTPFVFYSRRAKNMHINSQTANAAIKNMGFKGELVSHGLRAIASTVLNEQGFDPDLIEKALAHKGENEVRAAYNRADLIPRRAEMMQWWSDYIQRAKFAQNN